MGDTFEDRLAEAIGSLHPRHADLAEAAQTLASAIAEGCTLRVIGDDTRAAHASHVAVEYLHPVVAGRRAVPAFVGRRHVAVPGTCVVDLGPSDAVLGRADDPADGGDAVVDLAALVGAVSPWVGIDDVVLEVVHHIVWEATHVCLEHHRDIDDGLGMVPDRGDRGSDLAGFVDQRVAVARHTAAATLDRHGAMLDAVADGLRRTRGAGGRVWVAGNGGSAADAQVVARLLGGHALVDAAVTTALANDVGVDEMFVRQVEAVVGHHDTAMFLTTSATSPNVVRAIDRARRNGSEVVVLTGRSRGDVSDGVTLAVDSDSIHRIQESHLAMAAQLAGSLR